MDGLNHITCLNNAYKYIGTSTPMQIKELAEGISLEHSYVGLVRRMIQT